MAAKKDVRGGWRSLTTFRSSARSLVLASSSKQQQQALSMKVCLTVYLLPRNQHANKQTKTPDASSQAHENKENDLHAAFRMKRKRDEG